MYRLKEILVRSFDYDSHKEKFDEADKLLSEERARYNKNND